MTRIFVLAAWLILAGVQMEVRAQNAPVASTMRLEDLLIEIGDRFGIVIVAEESLDELITVRDMNMPVPALLGDILTRYSYLLVYSGKWSGPLAASPNRLRVFAPESGGAARVLDTSAERPGGNAAPSGDIDAIARVDDIIEALGYDSVHLASALAQEIATATDATVREEAVYALARIGSQFSLDALVQALGDESPEVREAVVMAIADSGYPEAQSVLTVALADASTPVREAAADALDQFE